MGWWRWIEPSVQCLQSMPTNSSPIAICTCSSSCLLIVWNLKTPLERLPFILVKMPNYQESLPFPSPWLHIRKTYGTIVPVSYIAGLSEAWSTARKNISKTQGKQKLQYDKKWHQPKFGVGDRVMVFMPQETKGKALKLASSPSLITGLITSWRSHQLAPLYDLWTVLISTIFLWIWIEWPGALPRWTARCDLVRAQASQPVPHKVLKTH